MFGKTTQLLQQGFERAAALPQEEQGGIARFLLAKLDSEERWAEILSRPESEELLEKMTDGTLSLHRHETLKDPFGALAGGKPFLSKSK